MSINPYYIVAAVEEHFGYLTFQFDGQTNVPYLTNASSLAYGYVTTEAAHDIATEMGLDSYEVVEHSQKVSTDCPRLLAMADRRLTAS